MYIILFLLYFLLLALAISRIPFFLKSNIKPRFLITIFIVHVFMACIHNWIAYQYYPNHGDIWFYFSDSVVMKQQLLGNPQKFLKEVVLDESNYNFTNKNLPRFVFQYELMKYINIIFDFFSFNNFYINSLLFSFFSFLGNIALFRFFNSIYKNAPLCAFCTLLLPSTLFWTSCIHKDGLAYTSMGFFYYYLYQLIGKEWRVRKLILCLLSLGLIFLARGNILIALLPAFFVWIVSEKKYKISSFTKKGSLIVSLLLLLLIVYIAHPGILENLSERQKEFQALTGNSRIYLPVLEPTLKSLISVFPVALFNGCFQPLPGYGGKTLYTLFSFELLLIWLLTIYVCYLIVRKKAQRMNSFDYSCLLFYFTGIIIIGFTIPFIGAIIRYRSIYLPFFTIPFIRILISYEMYPLKKANDWLLENAMIKTF